MSQLPHGYDGNDPIVIIDGSSDDSPVANSSPVLWQHSPEVIIEDVVADNEGKITWTDDFNIVVPFPTPQRIEGRSTRAYRYKGTVWNTLVVLEFGNNHFGVFLGVDYPSAMPMHMAYKFEFHYELLNSDGEHIATGSSIVVYHISNVHARILSLFKKKNYSLNAVFNCRSNVGQNIS